MDTAARATAAASALERQRGRSTAARLGLKYNGENAQWKEVGIPTHNRCYGWVFQPLYFS